MSKTARLYQDTRTANAGGGALDTLNNELQDVTRIMTKNMEELLWRGDSLDSTSLEGAFSISSSDVNTQKCPTSRLRYGLSLRNTVKRLGTSTFRP